MITDTFEKCLALCIARKYYDQTNGAEMKYNKETSTNKKQVTNYNNRDLKTALQFAQSASVSYMHDLAKKHG